MLFNPGQVTETPIPVTVTETTLPVTAVIAGAVPTAAAAPTAAEIKRAKMKERREKAAKEQAARAVQEAEAATLRARLLEQELATSKFVIVSDEWLEAHDEVDIDDQVVGGQGFLRIVHGDRTAEELQALYAEMEASADQGAEQPGTAKFVRNVFALQIVNAVTALSKSLEGDKQEYDVQLDTGSGTVVSRTDPKKLFKGFVANADPHIRTEMVGFDGGVVVSKSSGACRTLGSINWYAKLKGASLLGPMYMLKNHEGMAITLLSERGYLSAPCLGEKVLHIEYNSQGQMMMRSKDLWGQIQCQAGDCHQ